jgi:hypothetical protein
MSSVLEVERKNARRWEEKVKSGRRPVANEERNREKITQRRRGRRDSQRRETQEHSQEWSCHKRRETQEAGLKDQRNI